MKIAVYSPMRRQGSTTTSILLASALAQVTDMKVCITYTGYEAEPMNTFLGIKEYEDRTRSISQVIKLLEANTIENGDIIDYVTTIKDKLDIMETVSDSTTSDQTDKLRKYMFDNLPHDLIITDINTEVYEQTTTDVLNEADLIVLVLSQEIDVINKLNRWKKSEFYPDASKIVYVINSFNPNIGSLKDVCNKINTKPKKIVNISYNPFIVKMSNMGNLQNIFEYIYKKDIRVINLNPNMRELCFLVMSNLGIKIDWRK